MKLYADYIKEREDKDVLSYYFGFCIYKINKDHIYLQDVYISPEKRKEGHCKRFVDDIIKIANSNNIKVIITSFCLDANNWFSSKNVIKNCGFKYYAKDKVNNMIYCIRELN